MMYRNFTIFLFILLVSISCSKKEEIPPAENIKLVVGVDPNYPPFEFIKDSSHIDGFDIALINEISRINNWEIEFAYINLRSLLMELNQKKIDIVISALSATPEREVEVSFSKPYFRSGQTLAVLKEDSIIVSTDDLKGKRVGVQNGSTGQWLAKKIDGAQIFSYPDIHEAFEELRIGTLDAVINDFPNTVELLKNDSLIKTVGELLSVEYYAIAVRQNEKELLKNINFALDSLFQSSFYKKQYKKWFGVSPEILPTDSNFVTIDTLEE